jgi:hypothetical protein
LRQRRRKEIASSTRRKEIFVVNAEKEDRFEAVFDAEEGDNLQPYTAYFELVISLVYHFVANLGMARLKDYGV